MSVNTSSAMMAQMTANVSQLTGAGAGGYDISKIVGGSSSITSSLDISALSSSAAAASQSAMAGVSGTLSGSSTDFISSMVSSAADALKGKETAKTSGANSEVMKSAASLMTNYFKQFFPGMSDDQIKALTNMYVNEYSSLASAMDLSSLTSSVSSGSTSAASGASDSGKANNVHYGKNTGVSGLMSDANSMVGLNEHSNAAAINKITKKSGINCATTPWCAAWAMNMLKDHGVLDTSSCKNVNYCPTITSWAKSQNIWGSRGGYTPQAGDAILFDWNGDGTAQHIGIVEKVANGKVYTIEGNSSDSVKKNSYSLSSGKILGYINCAAQK